MANYENRIIGSKEINLDDVLFNPRNWRVHPLYQQNALNDVLKRVGWVQQVVVNQRTGHLVDGHLRCQMAARNGEKTIPALIVDLDELEEDIIIASIDPIAGMAKTDKDKLAEILQGISEADESVNELIERIAKEYNTSQPPDDGELLSKLGIETEPKTKFVTGDIWQLGRHTLICASPVRDVSVWIPFLTPDMTFIPYASPATLFSDNAQTSTCLCINPLPFVCGVIVDRYLEVYSEDIVEKI